MNHGILDLFLKKSNRKLAAELQLMVSLENIHQWAFEIELQTTKGEQIKEQRERVVNIWGGSIATRWTSSRSIMVSVEVPFKTNSTTSSSMHIFFPQFLPYIRRKQYYWFLLLYNYYSRTTLQEIKNFDKKYSQGKIWESRQDSPFRFMNPRK